MRRHGSHAAWAALAVTMLAAAIGCGGTRAPTPSPPGAGSGTPTEAPASGASAEGTAGPSAPVASSSAAAPSPGATGEGQPAGSQVSAPGPGAGPVSPCSEAPEKEQPVRSDRLGDGPRIVHVLNQTGTELQARLLDQSDQPAVAGTLRLEPQATGEFHVAPGTYRLRYRLHPTCEVLRGSTIQLTGNRAEAQIVLKAHAKSASPDSVKRVREEL